MLPDPVLRDNTTNSTSEQDCIGGQDCMSEQHCIGERDSTLEHESIKDNG